MQLEQLNTGPLKHAVTLGEHKLYNNAPYAVIQQRNYSYSQKEMQESTVMNKPYKPPALCCDHAEA